MSEFYEVFLGLSVGVGLAAACGFRIFVPLLFMSLAVKTGHLEVNESFSWLSSDVALASFAVATALEIGAYYLPWIDNMLDAAASPLSVIAGTVVMASFVPEIDPWLKWSLSVIAGGAAAGAVQSVTTLARGASTATTGGLANPVVSTTEAAASSGLSAAAIFLPALMIVGMVGIVGAAGWKVAQRRERRALPQPRPLLPAPAHA